MKGKSAVLGIAMFFCIQAAIAQLPADQSASVTRQALSQMNTKYSTLAIGLKTRSQRVLQKLQKQEVAFFAHLKQTDSTQAGQWAASSKEGYYRLLMKLEGTSGAASPTQYYSAVDSVRTGMEFIRASGAAGGFSDRTVQQASQLAGNAAQLQQQLEVSTEVQLFVSQREQQLKAEFSRYTGSGRLLSINKEVFYFQQQANQYKEMLNDKGKLEEKALSALQQVPGFQQFWVKNSAVSKLFPQRDDNRSESTPVNLQTKNQVQQEIAKVLTPGDSSAIGSSDMLSNKIEAASGQLGSLKDKLTDLASSLGTKVSGGSSSMTIPDFTPNGQHNKTFLQRIETGFSLQSGTATNFLPVTMTPAVYAGYRFSDKATAGLGAAYIIGLGENFQHFHFSSQGVNLRSYLDIKLKGTFWITGGFEYNYLNSFTNLQALKNVDAWRKSALIGLTKKYRIGKKEGKLQLLFDVLYAQEHPRTQPVVYRVGYSF